MTASLFIIFVCTGLFAYWLTRVHMATFRPERIAEILKHDLGLVRNILLALRSLGSRIG
jgi:predicted transcriptional regulator